MKNCKPLVIASLLGSTLFSAVSVEAKDKHRGKGHAYGHNKNWKNDRDDDDDRRSSRWTRRNYRNRGTQSTRIRSTVINGETRYYRIINGRRVYLRRSGSGSYFTPMRTTVVNGVTRYYRTIDGRRVYYRRDSYRTNGVLSYRYTRI